MTYFRRFSRTSRMHLVRLILRGILFLAALAGYLHFLMTEKPGAAGDGVRGAALSDIYAGVPFLLPIIWIFFMTSMIRRMFPSDIESPGSEKQFAGNYRPSGNPDYAPGLPSRKGTLIAVVSWIILNAAIGILYYRGVLDQGILLLLSLFYSLADVICILWFCPFQTWMMKNRCCVTCRIYNWDYPMMMTPFLFVPGFFAKSLLLVSLVVLLQWEYKYRVHPEYFSTVSNESLHCRNCTEKLCHHKKQLRGYFEKNGFRNTG